MMFTRIALTLFVILSCGFSAAQQNGQTTVTSTATAVQPSHVDEALAETPAVTTHHQISINGKPLKYTATAGRLLIKPENGAAEAAIFFTAYTLDGEESRARPLTFVFNGGPGTATAWLHLGALGPKKIKLEPDGGVPAPPYVTIERSEEHTSELQS